MSQFLDEIRFEWETEHSFAAHKWGTLFRKLEAGEIAIEQIKRLQEYADKLERENKLIKKQFDCLSKLVIFEVPELWEDYLISMKETP